MTGYTIRKTLPSEIILSQPKVSVFLFIMAAAGLVFITLAVLAKFRMINPPASYFSLFLGLGILFSASGFIFTIKKIPDTISFNKDKMKIIFTENGQVYTMPFSSFAKLLVSSKISGSGNGSRITYQLELISRSGSGILLCESGDKDELLRAAEAIISRLDIDLLSGGTLIHKGSGSYIEIPPEFPDESVLSIKKNDSSGSAVYEWNSRKSIPSMLLLAIIVFGFNYLLVAWAFPAMSRCNPGLYTGIAVLVLIDIFFSITLIFNLFGSHIVEISASEFYYRQKVYGFNINRKRFTKEETGMITCGFTSDENRITVFTKRGIEIYNELKAFASVSSLNDKSALLSLFPKVMELRDNIIEIDGTPLYYYEKLYLENEWSHRLRLKNKTGISY